MEFRERFTAEEWQSLQDAPVWTASAVMMAAPSGLLGVLKEMGELRAAMRDAVAKDAEGTEGVAAATELVRALVADLAAADPAERRATPPGSTAEEMQDLAIRAAQGAVRLVRDRLDDDAQAAGYAAWMLGVAVRVAHAAREETRFGMGGVVVSDDERAFLRRLAWAVGQPEPAA
jgi:hypothetical protein